MSKEGILKLRFEEWKKPFKELEKEIECRAIYKHKRPELKKISAVSRKRKETHVAKACASSG